MTNPELTGKINALAVVLQDVIQAAVAEAMADKKPAAKTTKKKAAPAAAEKKEDKKELAEKQAEAKQIAGKVMAALGKDILGDMLGDVGAKKFSDVKTVEDFQTFIDAATEALDACQDDNADDDLLGDGEPAAAPERTLDDVKDMLLQVNNHAELGRDVTKEILGELGVRRLPELDAEKYGEAYAAAEKAIKSVG